MRLDLDVYWLFLLQYYYQCFAAGLNREETCLMGVLEEGGVREWNRFLPLRLLRFAQENSTAAMRLSQGEKGKRATVVSPV